MNKCIWLILIISIILTNSKKQPTYRIVFDNIFFKHTIPEVISNYGASISNQTYISGFVTFRLPISKLDARVTVDMYRTNNLLKMRLFELKVDACQLLNIFYKNKLLQALTKAYIEHLNVIPSCPLKTNFRYELNNFTIREEDLPKYLPESKVQVSIHVVEGKTEPIKVRVNGRIIKLN